MPRELVPLPVALSPMNGTRSSQPGGGGSPSLARVCTNCETRSALSAMVEIPSHIGTTRSVVRATTITATARPRRPPRRAWTASRMGQVAMTIIVAQSTAGTNGRITQRLAAINTPMEVTWSVIGVSSYDGGRSFMACPNLEGPRHRHHDELVRDGRARRGRRSPRASRGSRPRAVLPGPGWTSGRRGSAACTSPTRSQSSFEKLNSLQE